MFLGLHHTKLERLNRVYLPEIWSEYCKDGLYVTQGFENNLIVHSKNSFQEIYNNITRMNLADPTVRLFSRTFLGTANFIEPGKSRQIQLSQKQMVIAEIKENITLVGQGSYMEIWSEENWNVQETKMSYSLRDPNLFTNLNICLN